MFEKIKNYDVFELENYFYASCDNIRIIKSLVQYEIFKKTINIPGDIIECGVFKGNSFMRLAAYRQMVSSENAKRLIGFDIFDKFPKSKYDDDSKKLRSFIDEAGQYSITKNELNELLFLKKITNFELVEGNINNTIGKYLKINPSLVISFLHIDVDIYEPTKSILKYLFPRLAKNGVIMLDDYGKFPGETAAVNEFINGKNLIVESLPYIKNPTFIVKK